MPDMTNDVGAAPLPPLLRRLRELMLGKDAAERPARIALLAIAVFGIGLRVFNYALHSPSLWQDEAYWAIKALRTEAIRAQIRPLGFMLVTQGLLRLVHAAPWVYRFLPFCASVAAMALGPYLALRLFRSRWVQLFSLLLLALNPVMLEMAVEFKHYGTEVGVYSILLAALLHHRETRSRASLTLLLVLAWLGFFFSITIIFFYPVVFGLLCWDALRSKQWRLLVLCGAVALGCVATIGTVYFTTWHTIKTHKAENKWGTYYDVFYIKNGLHNQYEARSTWTAAKYFELAATPGVGRTLWQTARLPAERLERWRQVDWAVWSLLHLAGIAYLIYRRRFVELIALWTPLLLVTAFNLAGRWPAGAFRTNTFYVPLAVFLTSYALEWLAELRAELRFVAPALCALLLVPTAYFRPAITEKGLWAKPGNFTAALQLLRDAPPKAERTLIMDYASCRPWDYYTQYDVPTAPRGPKLRRTYRTRCQRQTQQLQREMARTADAQHGFWMLMTDSRKFETIEAYARRTCTKVDVTFTPEHWHMVLRCQRGK